MKWASCPGSVKFVVGQFLKNYASELGFVTATITQQKKVIDVNSWHISAVSGLLETTTEICARVVVTLPNSTTYRIYTQLKSLKKGFKLTTGITIAEVEEEKSVASVKDSIDSPTSEHDDTWSHYE